MHNRKRRSLLPLCPLGKRPHPRPGLPLRRRGAPDVLLSGSPLSEATSESERAGGAEDERLLRLAAGCIINAGFVRSAGRRTLVGQHLPSPGPRCTLCADRYFAGLLGVVGADTHLREEARACLRLTQTQESAICFYLALAGC